MSPPKRNESFVRNEKNVNEVTWETRNRGIRESRNTFMTSEEWEKESDEHKIEWSNPYLRRVLTTLRCTPPKLIDNEEEISINRTVTSMTVKIRTNLTGSRVGKKRTQTQCWEVGKGLRIGAHK